jgi:hypothetical protein
LARHCHDDAHAVEASRNQGAVRAAASKGRWDDLGDEDWLERFEAWGQQGHFDHTPDFSTAMAFYHDVLQRAEVQTDPPYGPPVDFLPNLVDPSLPTHRGRLFIK